MKFLLINARPLIGKKEPLMKFFIHFQKKLKEDYGKYTRKHSDMIRGTEEYSIELIVIGMEEYYSRIRIFEANTRSMGLSAAQIETLIQPFKERLNIKSEKRYT